MQIKIECPVCKNDGLKIEINKGYKVVTSGRALSDFPMVARCAVCKRTIKYDVVKDEE